MSLADFLKEDGYVLEAYLDEAYKAQTPNGFQKEFKETDQRVSLLYNTLRGSSLKIFPVPNDDNNTWISPVDYREKYHATIQDTLYGAFINNSFDYYISQLYEAKKTGDYKRANSLLNGFKKNSKNWTFYYHI